MTQNSLNEIKALLFALVAFNVIVLTCTHLENRKKNESTTIKRIDSLETKIDSLNTIINHIPFTYTDSSRSTFLKNYQKFR